MELPEVWRTAERLVTEHGSEAPIEALRHADVMLARGDLDGQVVWLAVYHAAEKLLVGTRPPRPHLN